MPLRNFLKLLLLFLHQNKDLCLAILASFPLLRRGSGCVRLIAKQLDDKGAIILAMVSISCRQI
jgi:hypothetical protein